MGERAGIANNKILKSGIWYIFASFLTKGMVLISTPVFARLLSKAEYGEFSNYTSWLNIITIIVTLNVHATLINAVNDYRGRIDQYVTSVLVLSSAFTLICMAAVIIFSEYFEGLFDMGLIYILIMFAQIIFMMPINLFQLKERYEFSYKKSVILSLLLSFGSTVLAVILAINFKDKLYGRIIGNAIPIIAVGLFTYAYIVIKNCKVDVKIWRYALPICLPYIPHLLSMTLLNSMDKVMLTKMCGTENTALYSIAYTSGSAMGVFATALNDTYSPWLVEKLSDKEYESVRKKSVFYVLFFVYAALGIILFGPEVLTILGGPQYLDAQNTMIPIMMGCICQFMYTLFVNVEQYYKVTMGMALASISAAIINFFLNLILIPRFGYEAAAYTTMISYLWLLGVHMFIVYKIGHKKIYNYKFFVVLSILLVASSPLIRFLYTKDSLRFLSVGIYIIAAIVIFVKGRKAIMNQIRS